MKIGIDVDGVLRNFQTALLSRIRKSYPHYIETEFDEIPSWKMEDCFNATKEQLQQIYWHDYCDEIMGNGPSIKENVDFLRDKLNSKRDYSIVCVTSQKPHARHFTLKWLGNQQLNFDEVYLIGDEIKYAFKNYPSAKYFKNKNEVLKIIKTLNFENSTILLKASRGMQLENIAKEID